MQEKKEEPWYVYAIVAVVAGVMTYFAYTDYESFIRPDSSGSNKSNRLFVLLFNFIDSAGGKWLVMSVMLAITFYCIYKTVVRFKK